MQFLVLAYDGTDAEAPARRQKARSAHLEHTRKHRQHVIKAAAILDSQDVMIGSTMLMEFASQQELEHTWLASEPYVTGGVWKEINISPVKVSPEY